MTRNARLLLLLIAVVALVSGCASPPIVSVRTTADLNHHFAPPLGAGVQVKLWRDKDDVAGAADAAGQIVPADAMTLEERNFLAGVKAGLERAGFAVVGEDARTAYIMLASVDTATGMYDTYRRVPVMDTTTGFYHTNRGMRSYTATTSSDYIVPERRPYVHRIVSLAAIPSASVQSAEKLSPNLPGVVWRGRLTSDADVIDADLAHHVMAMLESWGVSASRNVKWKPAK